MATIYGKEVNTVSHDGKIFVLECGCNRTGDTPYSEDEYKYGDDRIRTLGSIQEYTAKTSLCKCNYYPWIILPEKK